MLVNNIFFKGKGHFKNTMMLTQHRRQSAKLSNIECSLWKCRNGNSEVFFCGINCGLRINEEDSTSCLAKFFLCWNMKLFHTALSPHNSVCWNKNSAVYNCAQIFLSVKLAKDRNVIQKFLNHKIQVAQLQAWTHLYLLLCLSSDWITRAILLSCHSRWNFMC